MDGNKNQFDGLLCIYGTLFSKGMKAVKGTDQVLSK